MPFDSKEWRPAFYRGARLVGIKQHRENPTRFMLEVNIRRIRRRKFVTIEAKGAERYQVAQELQAEFRADIRRGYFIEARTFGELFERSLLIKSVTPRWESVQRGAYRNHIARHLGALNVLDITPTHIDEVMAAIRGMAPASRKAVMSIIKAVLRLALEEKLIKAWPLEPRHNVKVNAAQQKTVVTDAQARLKAVHRAIVLEFADDPVMRAVFLFGLHGRRKAEVLRMKWQQVSISSGRYVIPAAHSKVKTDFVFMLPDEVAATLKQIKGPRRGLVFKNPRTGKEYSSIQRQVERVRRASGWDRFTFHKLRNLLASALHSRGVGAAHISSALGHTSPATVQQYLTMERAQPIIEQQINAIIGGEESA